MNRNTLVTAVLFFTFVLPGVSLSQEKKCSPAPGGEETMVPVMNKYVELPLLNKTSFRLKSPVIIIEGKFKLKNPEETHLNLVLARMNRGMIFKCNVYINDELVKKENKVIGDKESFVIKIKDYQAPFKAGQNSLKVVLYTSDKGWTAQPFKENPITVFDESRIISNSLVSARFQLREAEKE